MTKLRVINVDKNAAYPVAIELLKTDKILIAGTQLRQVKVFNNRIEQAHRTIKRITKLIMDSSSSNH